MKKRISVNGVLSSAELQAYLDDKSRTSANSLVAKALSAYASTQATSLQDLFGSLTGSTDGYTAFSYSV